MASDDGPVMTMSSIYTSKRKNEDPKLLVNKE